MAQLAMTGLLQLGGEAGYALRGKRALGRCSRTWIRHRVVASTKPH